ncbi:nucleolin [Panulirus ornatus]|uniref:nucleolin n=1 Tax=Panulirus ornatus TaxID=150431 RepID=UPI003A84A0FF
MGKSEHRGGGDGKEEENLGDLPFNGKKNATSKKKPRKRRRPIDWGTEKVDLTGRLLEENEGRVVSRALRTLYVRFPSTMKIYKDTDVMDIVKNTIGVRLPRTGFGKPCTYCYVEFESEEETEKMKEEISKVEVDGVPIYVDYVGKKSKSFTERDSEPVNPYKLYVGSVPRDTTRNDLKNVFHTSIRIDFPRDHRNNAQKRIAFITYKTAEEALRVFKTSENLKINGKEVTVMYARAKNKRYKNQEYDDPPCKKAKVNTEEEADISEES